MLTAIIYNNLTDQLIGALCKMLIHSLWQGVLLAAISALIIVFTKKVSAALRYNLLIGALLLFVAGAVFTFVFEFNQSGRVAAATVNVAVDSQALQVISADPVIYLNPQKGVVKYTTVFSDYLNTHHNAIVLIWFLIICAKSIQFAIGIQGVYLLKRTKVFAADGDWQQHVQYLANRIGVTRMVTLLESGLAKVPMVVGHLKPVILIPIGLLTAMSIEEVDAILVHELAHIRRRDYLVNLLQSLAEILFFFNPAVLWISQLIKTERENCCDDMALAETSSKVGYIRALVSCEEYQQSVPAYAMAFPGGKNSLVHRVKRMMSSRNHSLNTFEKGLLTICLVVCGLCLSAFSEQDNIKRAAHEIVAVLKPAGVKQQHLPAQPTAVLSRPATQPVAAAPANNNDTIKKGEHIHIHEHGTDVNIDSVSTITNANVNTQVSATAKVNTNMQVNVSVQNVKVNVSNVDSVKRAKKAVVAPAASAAKVAAAANVARPAVVANPAVSPYNNSKYVAYNTQYNDQRTAAAAASAEARKQAIDDMIKDGLIKSRDNLSFKLSTKEFIVNDKKQPDEVFQKYRAKYVKATGRGEWSWYYNYDTDKRRETNSITSETGSDYDSDPIK